MKGKRPEMSGREDIEVERLIFQLLATNLGTTFKAPTNLGTQKGEDSQ